MSFIGNILRFFMERGAKGKSYADLIQNLESSAAATEARFRQAADTPANRSQAAHVIGIEKWGQHRLHVALGAPLVQDEYNGYAPSPSLSMVELGQIFAHTRAETLDLARRLQIQGVPLDHKVKHNDMGEVTLGAWFGYLSGHGGMEAKRLKVA